MSRWRHWPMGLAALALGATGCVVHGTGHGTVRGSGYVALRSHAHGNVRYGVYDQGAPRPVVVTVAPPAPRARVTVRPARPATGAIWIDGHWNWQGGRWVWVPGRWVVAPGAGYVWVPPRTIRVGGRIQYVPGHWRRGGRPAVRARPAPSARPAPGAHVDVDAHGGTVTAPGAHVDVDAHGGTVTAPGVRVQGGVRGTTVTAPGAHADVDAHGGTVTAPGVRVQGGVRGTAVTTPGPRVRGGVRGTAVTTPGAQVHGGVRGTAVTTPGAQVHGGVRGTAVTTPRGARCSLAIRRVPPRGLLRITVDGAPAAGAVIVRLGGSMLPVVAQRRRGGRLQVQARARGGSGPLSVQIGSLRVGCGRVEVQGR